jgi:hypothetical protein
VPGFGAGGPGLAPGSGDGEERHERHALLAAGAQELVLPGAMAQAVGVLHAYHRRDLLGLGQVLRAGVGYPEVADQAGVVQFGQRAEVPGDRVQPGQAQVYQVQAVAAELAQVLLDLPAQLGRGGLGQPVTGWVPAGADLGGDDQVVGVRSQHGVDQLVGRAQRGEVEAGRVDVVHAELDRCAQHRDCLVTVARDSPGCERRAALGQAHRAEPDPVDPQVTERPGPRSRRAARLTSHRWSLPHAGRGYAGPVAICDMRRCQRP